MSNTGRVWLLGLAMLGWFAPAGAQQPARRAGTLADEAGDHRYYVVFRRQLDAETLDLVRARGGRIARRLPVQAAVAAYLSPESADALRRDPNVALIEPDPRRYLLSQDTPYGIPMVQANLLSDAAAANRKVCIIDSGYYLGHEDLPGAANVTGTDDIGGAGPWAQDGDGHGTHVAGTIAALSNQLGVVGVLPNAHIKLHIVRVFNDNGDWTYSSDLVNAVTVCRNAGAHVINMSLGGPGFSVVENNAFIAAYNAGVLSVAAAGNDGTTTLSYPASYDTVVSVAAIDSNKVVANFSQKNAQVELSAPGVAVNSTVPFIEMNRLVASNTVYLGNWMEFAQRTTIDGVTANLADGGECTASSAAMAGKIVLCRRGTNFFNEKVQNVINGGGVAAAIYNNVAGNFDGTLGSPMSLPAISLSQADGEFLVANRIGVLATIISQVQKPANGYALFNGTSMASPHVAGVAALIWSIRPACTNAQIRAALQSTAEDLGAAGRDTSYGFGLVRAKAAYDALTCGTPVLLNRRRGQTTSE